MGYNTGMLKYFIGVLLLNAFPMYVFGSGILTGWEFIKSLAVERSIEGATTWAIEYYVSELTPFPLNEFLTAGGFVEAVTGIGIALVLGAAVASIKWRVKV